MQVRDARNLVGFRHPVVGMHVRQGDACSDWSRPAPCPPLERYMEAARQMRLRYGVTTIYLATDSGVALASLQRELVAKDNFTILSLPGLDRGVFDSNLYIEFRVQMQLVPFPASPSCDAHALFLRHTRLVCVPHTTLLGPAGDSAPALHRVTGAAFRQDI